MHEVYYPMTDELENLYVGKVKLRKRHAPSGFPKMVGFSEEFDDEQTLVAERASLDGPTTAKRKPPPALRPTTATMAASAATTAVRSTAGVSKGATVKPHAEPKRDAARGVLEVPEYGNQESLARLVNQTPTERPYIPRTVPKDEPGIAKPKSIADREDSETDSEDRGKLRPAPANPRPKSNATGGESTLCAEIGCNGDWHHAQSCGCDHDCEVLDDCCSDYHTCPTTTTTTTTIPSDSRLPGDVKGAVEEEWATLLKLSEELGIRRTANRYEHMDNVGGWGGECTCPDGQKYNVGDSNNNCASLACFGGSVTAPCSEGGIPPAAYGMGVECSVPVTPSDSNSAALPTRKSSEELKPEGHVVHKPNVYVRFDSVGAFGGECTCPDGQKYNVGDNNNACGSLACIGGNVTVPCSEGGIPSTAYGMGVRCYVPKDGQVAAPTKKPPRKKKPTSKKSPKKLSGERQKQWDAAKATMAALTEGATHLTLVEEKNEAYLKALGVMEELHQFDTKNAEYIRVKSEEELAIELAAVNSMIKKAVSHMKENPRAPPMPVAAHAVDKIVATAEDAYADQKGLDLKVGYKPGPPQRAIEINGRAPDAKDSEDVAKADAKALLSQLTSQFKMKPRNTN